MSETTTRIPPHSTEGEQGALGSVLLDPAESMAVCFEKLPGGAQSFYERRHQQIYDVMAAMATAGTLMDQITITQHLRDAGLLESIGGHAYLSELQNATPSEAHLGHYLEIVREKFTARKLIAAASETIASVHEGGDIATLVADAETRILGVSQSTCGASRSITVTDAAREAVGRWQDAADGKPRTGIPFLVPGLGGIIRWAGGTRFIVIGARPSVGKSSVLLHIADEAAKAGFPVGIVSLEMETSEIFDRLAARETDIHYKVIADGTFTKPEQAKLTAALSRIKGRPIHIADQPMTLGQLGAQARRWIQRDGIKALFVDYLGLVSPSNPRANLYEHTTAVSKGLKALAMIHGIPVIAAAQLNRSSANENREPVISDLRDSGSTEQDANDVLLLSESSESPGELSVNVAKQRGGPRGRVQVRFDRPTCRFGLAGAE